jgi:uncharacterized cupredoxin-like copper-binding protein
MRKLTSRSLSALVAVALGSLALVPVASARTEQRSSETATTIQVKGGEFFLHLSTKLVPKLTKVMFVFKNIGHAAHDFSIDGKTTPIIQPGTTAKLVVTFKKAGKYPYLCTVPGHAAAGMKGTLSVR